MSTTTIPNLPTSPEAAHTAISPWSQKTNQPAVVSTQPTNSLRMTTNPEEIQEQNKAMRLRGGCIPCPDGGCCYIIPIPCCC